MPAQFQLVNGERKKTIIFGAQRVPVLYNGQQTIESVETPKVTLTDAPTTVSDEQAEALRRSRHFGTAFVEAGDTKQIRAIAEANGLLKGQDDAEYDVVETEPLEERTVEEADALTEKVREVMGTDSDEIDPEADDAVTSKAGAIEAMARRGYDASGLSARSAAAEIRKAAKGYGLSFPNWH